MAADGAHGPGEEAAAADGAEGGGADAEALAVLVVEVGGGDWGDAHVAVAPRIRDVAPCGPQRKRTV
ncbi:hypothetical protein GCM10010302_26940 [Streptomyces polychromogenes]|uniref:Uncharacterized protein n=1 Tax=Streptomyces polychromogenes TaxID=67342 RepID=A0ABN0VCB0_9ACTN